MSSGPSQIIREFITIPCYAAYEMKKAIYSPLSPPVGPSSQKVRRLTFLLRLHFLSFSLLLLAGFEPFHFHFQKISHFRICRNVLLNECSCNSFCCRSASLLGSGPCRNAESHSFSFKVSCP